MIIRDLAMLIFATVGVLLLLISAIGILRLRRVHEQMHAAGIASTVGVSAVLVAAGLHFDGQLWRMLLLATFFLFTAPVATTAIARAAYMHDAKESENLKYNALEKQGLTHSLLVEGRREVEE